MCIDSSEFGEVNAYFFEVGCVDLFYSLQFVESSRTLFFNHLLIGGYGIIINII